MTKLEKLKVAQTLSDLADILDIKPRKLSHALYIIDSTLKYTEFDIPKRSGGVRKIKAPYAGLKSIQSKLATLLQECNKEISLKTFSIPSKKNFSSISHGFKPNHSIFTNAINHRKKRYVFNADLENFFGSINFGRVRGFFIINEEFKLNPAVATVIAQIICHEDSLPQGSPCSPVMSNFIGHLLDIRLVQLACKHGCRYTRYADDLTFSTSKNEFPPQIAVQNDNLWKAGASLERLINKAGFQLNHSKSRMQYKISRQDVTGLVVNKRVNTNSRYRSIARAKVHELIKTGSYYQDSTKTNVGTIEQLNGILGFIDSIDLKNKERYSPLQFESKETILSSNEKVYRRFLIYKNFYAGVKPLIVFEGETDEVYLREAIRNLADKFPHLATKLKTGEIEFKIKFFHRSKTSARLLGLNGGSGEFKELIRYFNNETRKFHSLATRQPMILFIDNDSGGKPIIDYSNGIIIKDGGSPVSSKSPLIRINKYLYVVPTPLLPKDAPSAIEDFFDKKTLNTKLNKKTFNPDPKTFDPTLHYGKTAFATQVIQPQSSTIDFSGFMPILDRLQNTLLAFEKEAKS